MCSSDLAAFVPVEAFRRRAELSRRHFSRMPHRPPRLAQLLSDRDPQRPTPQPGRALAFNGLAPLGIALRVDLLDLSGYGYYNGVGYAMFWNKAGIEVGRGGCYRTGNGEDAVGFTLYINDLLDQLPAEPAAQVKTITPGTPAKDAAELQAKGFVTVFGKLP